MNDDEVDWDYPECGFCRMLIPPDGMLRVRALYAHGRTFVAGPGNPGWIHTVCGLYYGSPTHERVARN